MPLQCDVSVVGQVRAAVDDVVEGFGRLDILVNNAGAAPENPAERVVEEDFDQTLAVNLKGTFFACQAAGRVMIGQGGGRIVNMGVPAGAVALPGESVYCMTKAAIAHLTRCLAVEWGAHGINVNCVAPTFIRTPGTEEALADPDFEADVVERIAALHRIGEPMDVAGAVLYLCSPAAALVAGQRHRGGRWMDGAMTVDRDPTPTGYGPDIWRKLRDVTCITSHADQDACDGFDTERTWHPTSGRRHLKSQPRASTGRVSPEVMSCLPSDPPSQPCVPPLPGTARCVASSAG